MSHQDATLAELLLHEQLILPTRMHMQLNSTNSKGLRSMIRATNIELMKHLCLGIDVNTQWDQIPEDIRKAVLSRIKEEPVLETKSTNTWLLRGSTDVARKNLCIQQCLLIYEIAFLLYDKASSTSDPEEQALVMEPTETTKPAGMPAPSRISLRFGICLYRTGTALIRLIAIASTAGSDTGRETWYLLRNSRFQWPLLWLTLQFWKLCWLMKQLFTQSILLTGREDLQVILDAARQGMSRELSPSSIIVHDPETPVTGFLIWRADELVVNVYAGNHIRVPEGERPTVIAEYTMALRLKALTKYDVNGDAQHRLTVAADYEYHSGMSKTRWPISKVVHEAGSLSKVYYDDYGRIFHGKCNRNNREFQFSYLYKARPKGNSTILSAVYTCADPDYLTTFSVYWCVPRDGTKGERGWVPSGIEAVLSLIRCLQRQENQENCPIASQCRKTLTVLLSRSSTDEEVRIPFFGTVVRKGDQTVEQTAQADQSFITNSNTGDSHALPAGQPSSSTTGTNSTPASEDLALPSSAYSEAPWGMEHPGHMPELGFLSHLEDVSADFDMGWECIMDLDSFRISSEFDGIL